MTIFSFRSRTGQRDLRTDHERFGRLLSVLDRLSDEVEHERTGLRRRYAEAETSAAFAQQSFEDGGDMAVVPVIDASTETLMHCHGRLSLLDRQLALVGQLRQRVVAFLDAEPPK